MLPDRTLVLDLDTGDGPSRGHARFTYPPTDPKYEATLRHLGGLEPGGEKPVPPWPDDIDDARIEAAAHAHLATRGKKRGDYRLEIMGTDRQGNVVVIGGGMSLTIDPKTGRIVSSEATPGAR